MANYQELANLVWHVADDDRKDQSIDTYNRFKDIVPEESLPQIILNETNFSFYNTSRYDLFRLKAGPKKSASTSITT